MRSSSIIDVTERVDVPILAEWVNGLQRLMLAMPELSTCVIRGGAVVDALLGRRPNDIDLYYDVTDRAKFVNACLCQDIMSMSKEQKLFPNYIDKVDAEGSFEKDPFGQPVDQTCGLFSYHTDYISMLALRHDGQLFANKQGWEHLQSRIFEQRFEGELFWRNYPRPGDHQTLYGSMLADLVRLINYTVTRQLSLGPRAKEFAGHWEQLTEQVTTDGRDIASVQRFAKKKLKLAIIAKFYETNTLELGLGDDFVTKISSTLDVQQ